MARRSAVDTAKTHERILRQASRDFRAGGSSVGIADIMKELGLTHGGFYRHFGSKDELFVKAIALSFEQLGERLEHAAEKASPDGAAAAIIECYLSSEHLKHPETWCPVVVLAPDIGRMPLAVRRQIDKATAPFMERMSRFMQGADISERRRNFFLLFSGMAGAIAVARSLGDAERRKHALTLAREHYLRTFA